MSRLIRAAGVEQAVQVLHAEFQLDWE